MDKSVMSHPTTPAPAAVAARSGKARNVSVWVLQVLAAAMFFLSGLGKLAGAAEAVALFDAIGIGHWFRYLTGMLEVGGAVLLLVPALAGVGALLLAAVMVGAVFTHLFVVGGSPAPPAVLLAVVGLVAYARRERTLRLLGALRHPEEAASPGA